ncbi:MAG: energy-coupling factor transporter ATPase [Sphaerochaetaceae bacterium]|nr:energy-coupling factor transporter ATPase [Sphaerochaetaceae bacterium]
MDFISVRDLNFRYEEKQILLSDISFDIKKGAYVAIVGKNGSGKSTLAKLLIGLETADSGTIEIDGVVLNDENIKHIRSRMGIVFQNPDNQFIGATVRDDIAFGLENRCCSKSDMALLIEQFSNKVGLEKLLDKEPEALSGGQKQRVAIAGVLAMQSDIIILDEATSMLDPRGRDTIKKLIRELHQDKELTIISITHDIEEAYTADDCIVLCDGKVFDHGKPEEVFKDAKRIRSVGLDVPFIGKVKEAFKNHGIVLDGNSEDEIIGELCEYTLKR